jgi:hypothetical protein
MKAGMPYDHSDDLWREEENMVIRRDKGMYMAVGILASLVFFGLHVASTMAADPLVGQWNYSTSNHWVKGPVPAGKPSKGALVITQMGGQFKMEFKSGMVFSPPDLRYFTGWKQGQEYIFSNSAQVDNEGGVAKNTCNLKLLNASHGKGKSFSQYSNKGITFSWGFDIDLTR